MEQETPESINGLPDKEKYLKKQFQNYKIEIIQNFPLEKLSDSCSNTYFFILDYTGKRTLELIRTSPFDGFYTILHCLNRTTSLTIGSLLLTDRIDNHVGGIVTITTSGLDIILSLLKDRMINERAKLFDKLIEDIENIYVICKETAEVLRIVPPFPFSKELNETINIIKMKLDNFLERKDEYLETLNQFRGNKVIKDLIETESLALILKESISDYRQGISDSEIEKKIKHRKLELEVISSSIILLSQGINEVSFFETIKTFWNNSDSNNYFDKLLKKIIKGNAYSLELEEEKGRLKKLFGVENEKTINRLVNVVGKQIETNLESGKNEPKPKSKSLPNNMNQISAKKKKKHAKSTEQNPSNSPTIHQLQSQLTQIRTALATLTTNITQTETSLQTKRTEYQQSPENSLQTEINQLEQKLTTYKTQKQKIETLLPKIEEQIGKLGKEGSASEPKQESIIQNLEKDIQEINQELGIKTDKPTPRKLPDDKKDLPSPRKDDNPDDRKPDDNISRFQMLQKQTVRAIADTMSDSEYQKFLTLTPEAQKKNAELVDIALFSSMKEVKDSLTTVNNYFKGFLKLVEKMVDGVEKNFGENPETIKAKQEIKRQGVFASEEKLGECLPKLDEVDNKLKSSIVATPLN
ncbi:19026_t:CDS:2 [Funneliformis geosporum]|uniref:19026_t:CDS:1 n=1 Tax=Funneliformis geosporum TaxID=1117311 RepID=A0A9W4WQX9_9GLOM|nr:19026_t:CDS:2 [Funneliformis geosporum]